MQDAYIPAAYDAGQRSEHAFRTVTSAEGFTWNGINYFGDCTIEDFFDARIRYRMKRKHYKDGMYKTYVTPERLFRIPAAPAIRSQWGSLVDEETGEVLEVTETDAERQARKRMENLARAKHRIQEYVLLNDYSYFLTITLNDEKVDGRNVPRIMKKLSNWLNDSVKRKGLAYILVPELHPTSGRVHAHALINDALRVVDSGTRMVRGYSRPVSVTKLRFLDPDRNRVLRVVYNLPDWKYGFSTAIPVYGQRLALANYMCKYITKCDEKIFGKYYWSSKNQKKYPDVELIDAGEWVYYQTPAKAYGPPHGPFVKIDNHVTITRRETRMIDQISLIMDNIGQGEAEPVQ